MFTKNIKHFFVFVLVCINLCQFVQAQEKESAIDSTKIIDLKEIIILANTELKHTSHAKPLSSLDEYMDHYHKINMIKRGAYAWEPNLNNMSSERLSVTIDGMQIFGACTDKMDPITSYVDVSNLSEIHLLNGQSGNEYGQTIGGGIDLQLRKSKFINKLSNKDNEFSILLESGYETNNSLKVFGGSAAYRNKKFYIDVDATLRDAENYKDGKNKKVLYSQYQKFNTSLNFGFNLNDNQSLHTTVIYDKAKDIGYPALTMDVSSANAIIGSLSFHQKSLGKILKNWETKVYYNDIVHVMDDTTRPNVPIHMDMPGWSTTYGAYTKVELPFENHTLKLNLNGYLNKSRAEMTMYPADPNENLMFMLTWPDVQTLHSGLFLEDSFYIGKTLLQANARISVQKNTVLDDFGLNSLKIFHPDVQKETNRFMKSFGLNVNRILKNIHLKANLGYGERTASVSEAYGFYLFNSFDNYDYVGDPFLPLEKSIEAGLDIMYHNQNFKMGVDLNAFYIQDYIIGEIKSGFAPMANGASGIKMYKNLPYAQIANAALYSELNINKNIEWKGNIRYSRGVSNTNENLPLISPIAYNTSLTYKSKSWLGSVALDGAAEQKNFSADYGERKTAAYQIVNLALGKTFQINKDKIYLKAGVMNLLNKEYSTYTDWRKIPRMGRNFYINISYSIK